jgi:hypothetical protein
MGVIGHTENGTIGMNRVERSDCKKLRFSDSRDVAVSVGVKEMNDLPEIFLR